MKAEINYNCIGICTAKASGTNAACSAEVCRVCNGGELTMTSYDVFPGIRLVYTDALMSSSWIPPHDGSRILEIHHCREGRMERECGEYFCYLSPGDLSMSMTQSGEEELRFPLKHYHGVSVRIDIDKAPKCLSCFLDDVNVQPCAIASRYCGEGRCFVSRSEPGIEHIFSELYSVPESIRTGYFKVKILELLLFLTGMDISGAASENSVSRAKVSLAKCVSRYLADNLTAKISLEELSGRFHVSETRIKTCFKEVYGISPAAYMREIKMRSAALDLRRSDCTVLELAGRYGYDNPSKFAKVFRDIIGAAPNEYRCGRDSCAPLRSAEDVFEA